MRFIKTHILFAIVFMVFSAGTASGQDRRSDSGQNRDSKPVQAGIARQGQSQQKLANPPKVTARFIPDSVGIGDRFALEVEVDKDVMQMVGFPEFHDGKIGEIIEIISEGGVDTLKRDGRKMTLRKKYELTSFDEGWYSLGRYPMLYIDKNITDTIWSADSLFLMIGTFEIDTATMTIYDIKRPMETPLKFGEISGYALWGLLALAVLAALVWFIYTRRRNMSILGKPKPEIPPHVAAIKALESLHHQKLWQNNKHKLYYTGITEILREYIEKRYGVAAMEMTTHEIMSAIEGKEVPVKNYNELKEVLECADLVKFAKYTPDDDFNETAYHYAYYFVETTKPYEVEPSDIGGNGEVNEKEREDGQ